MKRIVENIDNVYNLTPMQKGMVYYKLLDENSHGYTVQNSLEIYGELNLSTVQKCLELLSIKYDILRSSICLQLTNNIKQVILKNRRIEYIYFDILKEEETKKEEKVNKIKNDDIERGFNLEKDSLLRVTAIKIEENKFELVFCFHHIIMDGWCISIIYSDFMEFYRKLEGGYRYSDILNGVKFEKNQIPQYKNYVEWLERQDEEEAIQYFKRLLEGYEGNSEIESMFNINNNKSQGEECIYTLDEDVYLQVKNLSKKFNVTVSMIFELAWGILLRSFINSDDVVFGKVVSGRNANIQNIEKAIGLFINTIPVRIMFNGKNSIVDLLNKLKKQGIESGKYDYISLSDIQNKTGIGRNLVRTLYVFENYYVDKRMEKPVEGLKVSIKNTKEQNNYPLTLSVILKDEIKLHFMYDTSLYLQEEIENIANHYLSILKHIVKEPEQLVDNIEVITHNEKEEILKQKDNIIDTNYKRDVVSIFEEQVENNKENIAIYENEKHVTYEQFHKRTNQLALFLETLGVVPNDNIVIMSKRSIKLLEGIYGVLKSGACYVPIDTSYNTERIKYILGDCKAKYILADEMYESIKEYDNVIIIDNNIGKSNDGRIKIKHKLSDNAYIIYTSGTTGNPKGVIISHESLVNYVSFGSKKYFGKEKVCMPLFTSISFDLTVTTIFIPLLTGNTIITYSEDYVLEQICNDKRIKIIKATPSHLKMIKSLKTNLCNIQSFIVGGEELQTKLADDIIEMFGDKTIIYNEYGPTEATVGCMIFEYKKDIKALKNSISIGKGIDNVQLFVMKDKSLRGVGMIGELCIGGIALAKGYINKEDLTNEKFIDYNYSSGGKIYYTGDLVKMISINEYEYLGRKDNQVKIRGYRIELSEIEKVISNNVPWVKEVVVLVKEEKNMTKSLCSYIVCDRDFTKEEIYKAINGKLPSYMIPNHYVKLDKIPVTINGKIDTKKLLECSMNFNRTIVEGRTEIEKKIIKVFKEVLQVEDIGIDDNFFEIGGDSIKAIQVVSLLTDYNIKIKTILDYPKIRDLSNHIVVNEEQIPQEEVTGKLELLPSHIYLLKSVNKNNINHFNQSICIKSKKEFNIDKVRQALQFIINQNDGLRLSYKYGNKTAMILPITEVQINVSEYNCKDIEKDAYSNKIQKGLSLEKGSCVNAGILNTEEGNYLLIVLHHFVSDGITQRIVYDEFIRVYSKLINGEEPTILNKTYSVINWSNAIRKYSNNEELLKEVDYWKAQIVEENKFYECCSVNEARVKKISFDDNISQGLIKLVERTSEFSMQELLLTIFVKALMRGNRDKATTIYMEGHGREDSLMELNISRTAGWFTTIYPLKFMNDKYDRVLTINDILQTKEVLSKVPNKGIGFSILDTINENITFNKSSRSILFNYLGSFHSGDDSDLNLVPRSYGNEVDDTIKMQHAMIVNIAFKDNNLMIDYRFDKKVFSVIKFMKISKYFSDGIRQALKLKGNENFFKESLEIIKRGQNSKNDFVDIINKSGECDVFLFPPAMLKVAYMPLYEKSFQLMKKYKFHLFHLIQNDNMDKIYAEYIKENLRGDSCVFIGYSGGANIAYDTALYMKDSNISVKSIIMLDGFKWEDGLDFVTLDEKNIDNMLKEFIEASNTNPKILEDPKFKAILNKERENFIKEAEIYQEYCQNHLNRTETLEDCSIYNLISQDVLPKEKDTRKSWDKVSNKEVNYIKILGNHISILANLSNRENNTKIVQDLLDKTYSNKLQKIICMKDVKRYFGDGDAKVEALKKINFTLYKGEFVVILGPSGSGKSTFLNVLSTLDKPSSGEVIYAETKVNYKDRKQITSIRKDTMGFVFQAYHLMPNLTVEENVMIGSYLSTKKVNVDEILDAVGLGHKKNKYPFQLSGGEQQRVSIARALAKESNVMFCDEPTGALDTKTGIMILELLKNIQQNRNLSVVIVTHNNQIAEIADRVIRMKDGEIISDYRNERVLSVREVEWA